MPQVTPAHSQEALLLLSKKQWLLQGRVFSYVEQALTSWWGRELGAVEEDPGVEDWKQWLEAREQDLAGRVAADRWVEAVVEGLSALQRNALEEFHAWEEALVQSEDSVVWREGGRRIRGRLWEGHRWRCALLRTSELGSDGKKIGHHLLAAYVLYANEFHFSLEDVLLGFFWMCWMGLMGPKLESEEALWEGFVEQLDQGLGVQLQEWISKGNKVLPRVA